jgi:hypothetical protein
MPIRWAVVQSDAVEPVEGVRVDERDHEVEAAVA